MNCSKSQELLSPYHDGELASGVRSAVEQHLQSCRDCSQALVEFRSISGLAHGAPDLEPPPQLWVELERELDAAARPRAASFSLRKRLSGKPAVLAAAIFLIALGTGTVVNLIAPSGDHNKHHMAMDLDHFLTGFPQNPEHAQQILLAKYQSKAVSLEEAEKRLGYRPIVPDNLPGGFTCDTVYLCNMSGCICVQTVYKRGNNELLLLIEHDADRPAAFGDHPAVTCRCNQKPTRIVSSGELLAASWSSGKRNLTLIGARDIEQVAQLMAHLDQTTMQN